MEQALQFFRVGGVEVGDLLEPDVARHVFTHRILKRPALALLSLHVVLGLALGMLPQQLCIEPAACHDLLLQTIRQHPRRIERCVPSN
jgi:hypothetical protein